MVVHWGETNTLYVFGRVFDCIFLSEPRRFRRFHLQQRPATRRVGTDRAGGSAVKGVAQ